MTVPQSWEVPNLTPGAQGKQIVVLLQGERWTHIVERHLKANRGEPWHELADKATRDAVLREHGADTADRPATNELIRQMKALALEAASHPLGISYASRFQRPRTGKKGMPVNQVVLLLRPGILLVMQFVGGSGPETRNPTAFVVTVYFRRSNRLSHADRQRVEAKCLVARYNRRPAPTTLRLPQSGDEFPIDSEGQPRIHSHVVFHNPHTWGFDENGDWAGMVAVKVIRASGSKSNLVRRLDKTARDGASSQTEGGVP